MGQGIMISLEAVMRFFLVAEAMMLRGEVMRLMNGVEKVLI